MNDLIAVEKIAQWQKLKALVLDSVSSPITKGVYNLALEEFYNWFRQEPRRGFTKASVSAWRVSLEARGLGSRRSLSACRRFVSWLPRQPTTGCSRQNSRLGSLV